jgi:hypothetical protein
MKFSPRAVSSIVAALTVTSMSTTTTTSAAPIATCGTQWDCLDFTFESIQSPICDDECEWRVCMKLNLTKPDCTKTGTVSHTCEKPDDECMPTPGSFGAAEEVGGIGNGYEYCQVVPPGGVAEFLLKDGNANPDCGMLQPTGLTGGGSAMCTTSPVKSCTGNGNIGKECVWSVTAPSECDKHGGPGGYVSLFDHCHCVI